MSDAEKKHIVVLTADAGFGHRQCAEAIVAALQELHLAGGTAVIVKPMGDRRVPRWLRHSQAAHVAAGAA